MVRGRFSINCETISVSSDLATQIERARVEELEWALVNDGKKAADDVGVNKIHRCSSFSELARFFRMIRGVLERSFSMVRY